MQDRADVIIGGGGIAGLSLAAAIKSALGEGARVTVCDPTFGAFKGTGKASAIAAGPRRMLETLGAWQGMGEKAQPILDMIVSDSRTSDPVRPVYLSFEGEIEPGEPFAHMIMNDELVLSLEAVCRALGVDCVAAGLKDFTVEPGGATAVLTNGETRIAALVVAADGARSRLRELAGIRQVGWSYGQSGIVATIGHARDHHGRAEEHFLPAGPFAILPLTGKRSSIVWTESNADADALVSLDRQDFQRELERRFGHHLGALEVLDQPRAWPLGLYVSRSFVARRFALVGDAAHLIHPIAGQGINLGLRDVAALAECVVDAMRLGLDAGDAEALERYQQARRFDTMTTAATMEALNRLFSNDIAPLRLVRDLGLGLVDRLPGLKRFFMREAAGVMGAAPRLLKGEPL